MTEVSAAAPKKSWKSKTLWGNLIMALIAFFPGPSEFFQQNPEALVLMFTLVNAILRFATKGAVQLLSLALMIGITSLGCACVNIDTAMAAYAGGEPTVLIDGCGAELQTGLLGIQIMEGATPDCELRFMAPAAKCDRESCAGFQFRRADGTAGFSLGIPKGQTEVRFKLADVLEHDRPLTIADEATYLVHAGVYFKNPDGFEELSRTKGHLHLIVLKEGYKPLGCGDPQRAWKFDVSEDCQAEVSTGYRTALCGEGCPQ